MMRLIKWIPAVMAGVVVLAMGQSAQAQFTVVITDIDNGSSITKTVTSGGSTTLDFSTVDGGSKFLVKTTEYASSAGDSIVASFMTTTGTGAATGDTYAVTVKSSTARSNLNGVGTGAGTLTAAVTTTTFDTADTINNKATYKTTASPSTTINTDATTDASGPNAAPTPTTKAISQIKTFTLSETEIFDANSSGSTDKWVATASVKPVYSVPEPTGVLLGLVGLPCLGAVVFFTRRRFAGMSPLVA
jgi:hypothetical protein